MQRIAVYKYDTFLSEASNNLLKNLSSTDIVSHNCLKFLDAATFNFHCLIRRKIADKFFIDNSSKKEEVSNAETFFIKNIYDGYEIRIREYTPLKLLSDEVILFVHGGGWVQGRIETHDPLCRKISNTLHRKVISVDYRLSPKYKFPIPLNDVLSAYLWCAENGYKNIILSGDSVGGNLCAGLCVKLSDMKYNILPISQILFYPVLSNDLESKSFNLFDVGYGLTKEWTKNYIYQYTGAEHNDEKFINNKFIYPLLEDAKVFPETFLISAGCDVLLDGQLEFVNKLKTAEINVYQNILNGSIHGFMTYGKYFDEDISAILNEINTNFV